MREIEFLLIAAQNNTTQTNYAQSKIDLMQQNNNCWLCGDRDEMINHIRSECSKLVQKACKTKHDWVRKVIYWELCKKLKFDHTTKCYMYKSESVQENETYKILWNLGMQTDHLIATRRPDRVIIKKKRREPAEL